MSWQFTLSRSARTIRHFAAARGLEVLVLQGSPFLGALLGSVGHDGIDLARLALLLLGSLALTAHVFVFNDWTGESSDLNDPRRTSEVFALRRIAPRQVATLAAALLVVAILVLAFVGAPALLYGAAIAAVSLLYSGSTSWGKGRPIVASLLHLIGGTFHFLLGYTAVQAVDARGVAIAFFFGLVFAGGHLNQEVRDYDADLRNGIRTTAVAFGRRRTFLCSLLVFTAAYLLLGFFAWLGMLARPLIWATLFWPFHVASSVQAFRRGLGFEIAVWMQRRYRLQFALLGVAMVLTTPPLADLARRFQRNAHDRALPAALGVAHVPPSRERLDGN
jgi:4-hydroxybenzoate polyprenyltransferase